MFTSTIQLLTADRIFGLVIIAGLIIVAASLIKITKKGDDDDFDNDDWKMA
jgi:hypothetical protein